jgi:NitT/TauT family transport system permease protein
MVVRANGAVVRGIVGTIGMAAVAELISRIGLVDPATLPPVSSVLVAAGKLAIDHAFLVDVAATLAAWAGGLAAAIVVAVPLGLLLGWLPGVNVATRALVELLRPIPSVALIPLAITVFGSGTQMKMALVFYAACWPILVNTVYALHDVDPVAKETVRSFGFGPLAVLARVSLPSAAPFIVTGVRLSASIGIVVAISSELLAGGAHGIGVFLSESQSGGGQTATMLAGAVWAGLLGLLINTALVRGERRFFGWHHRSGAAA